MLWRETMALRAWARLKVPMIAHLGPRVLRADDDVVTIRLPLRRRSRNHLKSMYFGALQVGADVAGGYAALMHANKADRPVSFVFKDAKADFLRRAEGDVDFTCEMGARVRDLVDKTLATGERVEGPVTVVARVGDEEVARFVLTVSMRAK